jgi:hypothetical protein
MHLLTRPTWFLAALLAFASAVTFTPTARAQNDTPEQAIRSFYTWYVQAIIADKNPLEDDRATLRRPATARLISEIDKMRKGPDGLNGDYFLDAQDFDREWAQNIRIGKPEIQGDKASVKVELRGKELGNKSLAVSMRREGAAWKVDKVAAQ